MARFASTLTLLSALSLLLPNLANAQPTQDCQSNRIFNEPVHADSFPMTPLWGVGLDVIGSATDKTTPKDLTSPKPKTPSNFYIANDTTKRLHVWLCEPRKQNGNNASFSIEFDLPPDSFYETSLGGALYGMTVSTEQSIPAASRPGAGNSIWFGVVVPCAPTCYTSTIHFAGPGNITQEVWAYKRFEFFIRSRGEKQYQSSAAMSALPRGIPETPDNTIQQEIAKIRNGRNAPMPPAQASAANLGGQTGIAVENSTSYTLTVFLSGPMSQKIQLAPGGSQTVTLSPGNYEVAASVSSPNVLPFYGKEAFGANTQYSEKFYIASR